jgi:hypothetical protein
MAFEEAKTWRTFDLLDYNGNKLERMRSFHRMLAPYKNSAKQTNAGDLRLANAWTSADELGPLTVRMLRMWQQPSFPIRSTGGDRSYSVQGDDTATSGKVRQYVWSAQGIKAPSGGCGTPI